MMPGIDQLCSYNFRQPALGFFIIFLAICTLIIVPFAKCKYANDESNLERQRRSNHNNIPNYDKETCSNITDRYWDEFKKRCDACTRCTDNEIENEPGIFNQECYNKSSHCPDGVPNFCIFRRNPPSVSPGQSKYCPNETTTENIQTNTTVTSSTRNKQIITDGGETTTVNFQTSTTVIPSTRNKQKITSGRETTTADFQTNTTVIHWTSKKQKITSGGVAGIALAVVLIFIAIAVGIKCKICKQKYRSDSGEFEKDEDKELEEGMLTDQEKVSKPQSVYFHLEHEPTVLHGKESDNSSSYHLAITVPDDDLQRLAAENNVNQRTQANRGLDQQHLHPPKSIDRQQSCNSQASNQSTYQSAQSSLYYSTEDLNQIDKTMDGAKCAADVTDEKDGDVSLRGNSQMNSVPIPLNCKIFGHLLDYDNNNDSGFQSNSSSNSTPQTVKKDLASSLTNKLVQIQKKDKTNCPDEVEPLISYVDRIAGQSLQDCDMPKAKLDFEGLIEHVGNIEKKVDTSLNKMDKKIDTSVKQMDKKLDTSVKRMDKKLDTSVKQLDTSVKRMDKKLDTSVKQMNKKLDTSVKKQENDLETISFNLICFYVNKILGIFITCPDHFHNKECTFMVFDSAMKKIIKEHHLPVTPAAIGFRELDLEVNQSFKVTAVLDKSVCLMPFKLDIKPSLNCTQMLKNLQEYKIEVLTKMYKSCDQNVKFKSLLIGILNIPKDEADWVEYYRCPYKFQTVEELMKLRENYPVAVVFQCLMACEKYGVVKVLSSQHCLCDYCKPMYRRADELDFVYSA